MKIAHLADAHLGFRQYHRQTPNGINQREADVAAAFRLAIDGVIAARPDAVVVAGDLFHSVRPSNPAILFAFREFQRLRDRLPVAPVILIAGNHDTPRSTETGSILRLFETLGVDVVADEARRLVYPALDLSVLAVPHEALVTGTRPVLEPEGKVRHQVLVIHGEVEGLFHVDRSTIEYGGALLREEELTRAEWQYVALGHYHVRHQVAPRVWYSGALEYVSSNPWGERKEEARGGAAGKGWLLVDLPTGDVAFQPLPLARRVIDLDPVDGAGHTAGEIDAMLAERMAAVPGGIEGQILRLVVWNIPRHTARELDHARIREWKSSALHFHLDLRRPESRRETGVGAPGRRQTLPEILGEYLAHRPLPADLDRSTFIGLGLGLLDEVEREAVEA
ncbi:MAG: exonuclease SbcCD subunit D [Gemmatimonadales bacterium]